ncbi:MAG: hypothetical protein KDE27_04325 [Planctomycetes bacterium]|nr:hypothetical protein [Planctomycetota bacterium]
MNRALVRAARIGVVAFAAAALRAQVGQDPQEEWGRTQHRLEQNRAEVDRLVDMRFRHDLGLPGEDDPTMPRKGAISTIQKEQLLRELREQDGHTASLLSRFNSLKSQLDSLRTEAQAREQRSQEEAFVVVPSAGSAQRSNGGDFAMPAVESGRGGIESPGNQHPGVTAPFGGAPNDPRSQGTSLLSPTIALGRVRGQIRGSEDHLRVAQSLFKAGQALMDEAERLREERAEAAATELDARAKQRLERAIVELDPLLQAATPPYPALFCQGRCLELLFRFSVRYEGLSLRTSTRLFQQREQEVRDPFLAIAARDVTKSGAGNSVEQLGAWGMAANAAVEHFRWMNQHGSYEPVTPIESITWPGEKDR